MERITYKDQGNIKKVTINNPIRNFLIFSLIAFLIMWIVLFLSGVEIEAGMFFEGISQPILYLIVICISVIVILIPLAPKVQFISDLSLNKLIIKRTNYLFIKTKYNFNLNDKINLIGKKKLSIVGTVDEGIVRAYRPFFRYYKNGRKKDIKLFPWVGLIYISILDQLQNTFSLTKKELEKISNFLKVKLLIEW
jgi:hypothetical protein